MSDQQTTGTQVAVQPERQYAVVENLQPMLDTSRFEHFQRAAKALMYSSILNPSVRGNSPEQCFSNLMLVFDLSDRWKLPPLSIAQGISIVHDKVVYEGKLIAAMLQSSLGVRLHYHWTGERGTDDYRIYVADAPWDDLPEDQLSALTPGARIPGRRVVDGSVAEWRTMQKDGRTVNPAWTGRATQNQLSYRGAREWARLFEPAQMLGVYGDDEIELMTLRLDAATTPRTSPLLGGMKADDIIDADVEPVAEAEPAADQGKAEPPKRTAKQQKVVDDRKADLERAQAMGEAAYDAALWGNNDLEALLEICTTDEQRGYTENEWRRGRAEHQAEVELAYEVGLAGNEMAMPEWFSEEDQTAKRRLADMEDAWQNGRAAFEASEAADAEETDDADPGQDADELDIEGDEDGPTRHGAHTFPSTKAPAADASDDQDADHAADPGLEDPAFAAFIAGLDGMTTWADIKASLVALVGLDAWKAASPDTIAQARAAAWRREAALIEAETDKMDFLQDLTAFRCWLETTADVDAINGNWQAMVRQPLYQNLKAESRSALEKAVRERVAAIRAAQKGAGQ